MNEEQRKSMELAKQVVTSFLERNNAAEMREILKDPDNWEGLQRSHGDNYYEKLVLRSIRGLMPDEIIIVLKLCYQKRQPSISKKDFANRIFYINETTPNGYKLSDTHRQIIREWAETESEQPQQENELPGRVRKGLEYPKLISVFISPDKAREFLIYCEKYSGTDEKSKIPRQARALVKQNIISEAKVNIVLHTLLLEIGFSEEEIGNYTAWRKATLRAR